MKKILVNCNLTKQQQDCISDIAAEGGYTVVFAPDTEQAKAEAVDAEIIFGKNLSVVKEGKEFRWLCTQSAGVNAFITPGVLPEGCLLTNSSGAYGVTLSEHMIMASLMVMRRFRDYDARMETIHWRHDLPMSSLYGATVTVLGTGDIGTNFAKRVKAFQPAKVIGVNRSGRKPSDDFDEIGRQDELEKYLPETDLLAMSLPETPETIGILSRERIALLPETAYIVNVGRGSAIDEAALVEALNAGRIAGAALDVMVHEPLPLEDPLRSAKNILLTPHTAGQMTIAYTQQKSVDQFCEDLKHYLAGEPLVHLVDLKTGY